MVIVYTAILGGSDSLKPAPAGADRCVCFSDGGHISDSKGWEIEPQFYRDDHVDSRRAAWHLRCVPNRLFGVYDTVVWVDASFTMTDLPRLLKDAEGHELAGLKHHKRADCYQEGAEIIRIGQADAGDVTAQLSAYRKEGFRPSGLTIGCILVRQNTPQVNAFNERWDAEIKCHPGDNCQLSIDYAAWKHGLSWHHLGSEYKDNPYAKYNQKDHKLRRNPYRQLA